MLHVLPVQVSGLHLPDVEAAVVAADEEEVLLRPPLDAHHREDLPGGQHDAAPLLHRERTQHVNRYITADQEKNNTVPYINST